MIRGCHRPAHQGEEQHGPDEIELLLLGERSEVGQRVRERRRVQRYQNVFDVERTADHVRRRDPKPNVQRQMENCYGGKERSKRAGSSRKARRR
jgi:hypothetical protein